MATLRKKTNNSTLLGNDDDDIESSTNDNTAVTTTTTRLINAPDDDYSSNTNTTTSTTTTSSLNPFFLHAIRRKVLSLLFVSDNHDGDDDMNSKNQSSCEKIISILRDIILGSILGLVTISFIMILDHKNIIHLQSAHNFRNAAFQLLHDPETISYMETNMDVKFMSIAEYNSTKKEMDKAVQEMERLQKLLDERSAEGDEKKELLDSLSEEYNTLLVSSTPILGFDKFCGSCKWGGSGTCDDRVQYLMDKYGNSLLSAKLNVMESHESCKK